MKLIDILVRELPKRGGWPDGVYSISQFPSGELCYHDEQNNCSNANSSIYLTKHEDGDDTDWAYGIYITREQYEAALAAKNDGWIDWDGGECPVDTKTLVDIKLKDGFTYKSCHAGDYSWRHGWHNVDIIAYRLHKPQEETEADGEADLNECIGQDAATAWDRDGIPPVGCECEFMKYERGYHEKWRRGTVMYVSGCTVVIDDHNPGEVVGHPCNFQFRPLSSEADKKRGAICDAIYGALTKAEREHNRSDEAEAVYDAIAAGKIPGVKLEG